MKITKYPQSCLMIETKNKKILVDPGSLKYQESFLEEWKEADVILITHKHGDHIYQDVVENLSIPIYATREVVETYPNISFNIVKEGDVLSFDEIKVEVVKAIHGYNPMLKGAGEVFESVGYIIDDLSTRFYTTSDTICFNNDYKADVVALPITGCGLTMSSFEAALFAKELGVKLVLPVHMDNKVFPPNLAYMEESFKRFKVPYQVMSIGESIEI